LRNALHARWKVLVTFSWLIQGTLYLCNFVSTWLTMIFFAWLFYSIDIVYIFICCSPYTFAHVERVNYRELCFQKRWMPILSIFYPRKGKGALCLFNLFVLFENVPRIPEFVFCLDCLHTNFAWHINFKISIVWIAFLIVSTIDCLKKSNFLLFVVPQSINWRFRYRNMVMLKNFVLPFMTAS